MKVLECCIEMHLTANIVTLLVKAIGCGKI